MKTQLRRPAHNGERGQVLVLTALMMVAFVAVLAMVFDLGMSFARRRFAQNAADAAVLAASRMMASNISPLNNAGAVYFVTPESDVYAEVRRYAGLPTSGTSTVPTGVNQYAGFAASSRLAVSLEYWDGQSWCYSPSGAQPPRNPPAVACALPAINGVAYPPFPAANAPYRLRVTVSSTAPGVFGPVIGVDNLTPPPSTNTDAAACVRVTGVKGNTLCTQATASIRGSAVYLGAAPIIPPTTGDCTLVPSALGSLFELWGSNPSDCGYGIGSWKTVIDLSAEQAWCDSRGADYKFQALLPPLAHLAGSCATGPDDTTWNRNGYSADPRWPGSVDQKIDVTYWIAAGFKGSMRADTPRSTDGTRFPTYIDANPAQTGDMGNNIAVGFYCGSNSVTSTSCDPTVSPSGTYFFAKNQSGFFDLCPDTFGGQFGVGCRDATVATWTDPQWATGLNSGGTGWTSSGSGAPDRIRIARLLTFRLYCDHGSSGLCNQPPRSVVGSATNSTVWGRFIAPFSAEYCPSCTVAPSLLADSVNLEQ